MDVTNFNRWNRVWLNGCSIFDFFISKKKKSIVEKVEGHFLPNRTSTKPKNRMTKNKTKKKRVWDNFSIINAIYTIRVQFKKKVQRNFVLFLCFSSHFLLLLLLFIVYTFILRIRCLCMLQHKCQVSPDF